MKPFNWRIPVGLAMVALGVLAFLTSMQVIHLEGNSPAAIVFVVLFGLMGASFLYALVNDRSAWWAAIPGLTLLGLAALIGLTVTHVVSGEFGAFIFLGSIAASFWVVYLLRRDYWWAIIPGGTMTSVALLLLIVALAHNGVLGASVLFLGMAVTFGVLALVKVNGRRMAWPWFPAAALALVGGIIAIAGGGATAVVWAILIILAGLYLVARPYIQKNVR